MGQYLRAACAVVFLSSLATGPGMAQVAPVRTKARPDPAQCPKPQWPKAALREGQTGAVKLQFLIGVDGKPHDAALVRSSGHASLDGAALRGLRGCSFIPATENGKPVPAWDETEYVWMLTQERSGVLIGDPPRALQAFMLKARKADDITEPLERCLAFPDYPGNAWPDGLAKAACHFLLDAPITRQQVAAHLASAALAELEELYRRDLERHFTRFGFSEIIHRDIAQFDASEDAGRLSAAWLAQAPRSPFANAARAAHLAALAWKARGGAQSGAMSSAHLQRMSQLAAQATTLFASALALERRMLPAHAGMVDMATLGGDKSAADAAFASAAAIDPACHAVDEQHMLALGPRWGGSMDAMDAFARKLAPFMQERPLVALNLALPAQERGDDLFEAGDFRAAVKLLDGAALGTPSPDLFVTLGLSRIGNQQDRWDSLVPLLVASRFADDSFRAALERGVLLLRAGASEWAVKPLRRAHDLQPDSIQASFTLGMGLYAALDYKSAEPFVATGLADEKTYPDTRLLLGNIAMRLGEFDKAAQYSADYVKANPASEGGWYLHGYASMLAGAEQQALAAFATYLRIADKQDGQNQLERATAQEYIAGDRSRTAVRPIVAAPAGGAPAAP